jgi:ATP-binding cassette, subfamily B, bacterial
MGLAEKSPNTPHIMGIAGFLRALYRYLKPYRSQTLLVLFLLLINTVFLMGWPLSFKFLIDKGISGHDQKILVLTLAVLVGGAIIASLAGVARGYLYAYLSAHVLNDIRQKIFAHLQQLSMSYYSRTRTGDILARFSTDLTAMENAVTWAAPSLIMQGLSVVVGIVILFTLEWRLALLTLLGLLLCVIVPRKIAANTAQMGYEFKKKEAQIAQSVQEIVGVQAVVKAFGLREAAIREFAQETSDLSRSSIRFTFSADNVERIPNIIILIFEIFVIGAGVLLVYRQELSLGTLVALHALYVHISFSVGALTKVVPVILRSVGGLQRIEDLLAEKPEVADNPGAVALPRLSSMISFRDVTFAYDGNRPVLERINFHIPRGSSVAFVGPSGSGKSTVLNLLLRFYDPTSGSIYFDDTDAKQVIADSLRAHIGIVFQDSFLFNRSIRENIRMGKPDATEQEIRQAAQEAEIHDGILELQDGYDTIAGELGSKLSGGQRQRIGIARALLRNPEILVLDEATSALDPQTEHAVNQTLARAGAGRTVVSVTHRLAIARDANCIFLLKNGTIAEQGRHDELITKGGLYAQLWQKQSGFSFSEAAAQVEPSRLKRYPIFESLDAQVLERISSLFVTESYPADRVVVREGTRGNRFYLIARGQVAVQKLTMAGTEEMIAYLEDGDYFGEIALVKNVPRVATVRTITPCVMLTLHRDIFQNLLDRAPEVREKIEKTIIARTQHNV